MYIMNLIVGDYSGDGYDVTSERPFVVNMKPLDVEKAFRDGSKMLGVDLSKLCDKYQEDVIDSPHSDILLSAGFDMGNVDIEETGDNIRIHMDDKAFRSLWLQIAKYGNNGLEFSELQMSYHDIGGYGLLDPI